ncbi:MAG: hypothetical protein JW778_04040 [Candidatus Altiarchaeota archaeon]|nr:hypothetical protein [Candidatus Altiarchaeota archaeon]
MKAKLSIEEVIQKVEERPEILDYLPKPYKTYIQALMRDKKKGYVADPRGRAKKGSPSP